MYILNVKALKSEINQAKVNDRYLLPYLIGYCILISIASAINIEYTAWDHAANVMIVLLTGPAVYFLYRSNSSNPEGSFLSNWLLMSWVCGFRYSIFFMVPLYVIMMIAGISFGGEVQEPSPFSNRRYSSDTSFDGSIVSVLFYILFVIYTAKHIRSIRKFGA